MNKETIIIKKSKSRSDIDRRYQWFKSQPGCIWLDETEEINDQPLLHITHNSVFLSFDDQKVLFHPSMALLRLINLFKGENDRFLQVTALKPGDSLLDATMGLATDALIGAWAVGEKGRVIAIENSAIITSLVRDGLDHLANTPLPKVKNMIKHEAWKALSEAAQNIEIFWDDHLNYLRLQPSSSVEVVYFDPMFRRTREQSASIKPLHLWANHNPLTLETIEEACRVASRCVVMKERKGSQEFKRLGFKLSDGGKYSQIDYGIILI